MMGSFEASSENHPSGEDEWAVRENGTGGQAVFRDEEELPVIAAADAERSAAALGFSLIQAEKRFVMQGLIQGRLLLKTWRNEGSQLALYFRPTGWARREAGREKSDVWRVLVRPDRLRKFRPETGGPDLRRVRMGTWLTFELTDSKGWPQLESVDVKKGQLLGDAALQAWPGRTGQSKKTRGSSAQVQHKAQRQVPEADPEEREGEKGAAPVQPAYIRKGLWTRVEDGMTSGLVFADGRRVSDSSLMDAWKRGQAVSLSEDHDPEKIAAHLEVPESKVRNHIERGRRLVEQRLSPGALPDDGLTGADVRAYVRIKHGQPRAESGRGAGEDDGRDLYLIAKKEGERLVKEGPFRAGDPRIEAARHWEDTEAILKSTGLRCRDGNILFEQDVVRAGPDMEAHAIAWSREHLRWEAGEDFSLAQMDAIARERFGAKGLERIE